MKLSLQPCLPTVHPGQVRVFKNLFAGMMQLKMGLVKMRTEGHVYFHLRYPLNNDIGRECLTDRNNGILSSNGQKEVILLFHPFHPFDRFRDELVYPDHFRQTHQLAECSETGAPRSHGYGYWFIKNQRCSP